MFTSQEQRPLLRSLSEVSVNRIGFGGAVAVLVIAWCVLDSWNHTVISNIFRQSEVRGNVLNPFTGQNVTELNPFNYTLTLAFLQFAFMGIVFSFIFALKAFHTGDSIRTSLGSLRSTASSGHLPALVGTHMFGSVLVQSLMMPTNMMSLPFFAATRAVEVPVAAGIRAKVFGEKCGGRAPHTIGLMFGAAWLLFYSHTQIAECLCVWSGFGVALTGLPLYFVYALLLTIPSTNLVLQESVMTQFRVSPILMQAVQNLCAALLFAPALLGAHWSGYENVHHAFLMITGHLEIMMAVLWLCVQTVVISAITVSLISMVDSFWTVAARSLRVVYWWIQQLAWFYLTSGTLLSVARPHASLWSLGMLGGISLGACAVFLDSRHHPECPGEKQLMTADPSFMSERFGMAKYV